jgi:hypothetical protein
LKFPQFPARFPGVGSKSAHFGQKVQISRIEVEKFADKFPAAGNLFSFSRLTNSSFGQSSACCVSAVVDWSISRRRG